jgi:hypothetical protein
MEKVNEWFGLSPNPDDFTRGRYDARERWALSRCTYVPDQRPWRRCTAPAGLALFAAHAVLNKFSDAARARTGVGRVAALPGELTTSFELCFEHAGLLAHDAGTFLGATWERPAIFCKCV